MDNQLTAIDIEVILEALKHTKMKYEQTEYQDQTFKREQLKRVENIEKKLRVLQSGMGSE